MYRWFKKKFAKEPESDLQMGRQLLGSMALATALAETIAEYLRAVESGEVSSPAYKRNDDRVVEIWKDTRIEALRQLWGYGASDPGLLADHRQQKNVLEAYFEEKPQYEHPHQPSGEPVHDTLQALFQVYLFLDEAGSSVADKETDRLSLKLRNKNIFSEFEEQARLLREEWSADINGSLDAHDSSSMPSTILERLYADVTKKAKTIALSSQFGPNYRGGMNDLLKMVKTQMKERGESATLIDIEVERGRAILNDILMADDPDYVA